jgi:hypothetical protein
VSIYVIAHVARCCSLLCTDELPLLVVAPHMVCCAACRLRTCVCRYINPQFGPACWKGKVPERTALPLAMLSLLRHEPCGALNVAISKDICMPVCLSVPRDATVSVSVTAVPATGGSVRVSLLLLTAGGDTVMFCHIKQCAWGHRGRPIICFEPESHHRFVKALSVFQGLPQRKGSCSKCHSYVASLSPQAA